VSHSHSHAIGAGEGPSPRRLTLALGLIASLMVLEVLVGALVHSLALISDAAHMLTDAAALGLGIIALRLAQAPARGAMTYGLRRVEILSAQINGATLLVLSGVIVYSAIGRLVNPAHVSAWPMVAVALVGIVVNGAATIALAGAGRENLSIEGSFQHILTDLFAFVGTAIAGTVILLSGFERADPIASLVVVGLMLRSSYGLLRDSTRVFLEAAPHGLEPEQIGLALASEPDVVEVHDLHVWEVSSGFPALSAHVLVGADTDCHRTRRHLESLLHDRYGIDHTTLQVEHESDAGLIQLGLPDRPPDEPGESRPI
jgi:cobalt-zinc-cadmium efflux system protein